MRFAGLCECPWYTTLSRSTFMICQHTNTVSCTHNLRTVPMYPLYFLEDLSLMESAYQCENKQRACDSQFEPDIDSVVAHIFDDLFDAAHEDVECPLLNSRPPPAAPAPRQTDTHFVPATEAQKLLVTISTINRCLNEHPQSKVLVALASNSSAREFTRHLQLHCVAHAQIQHLGETRTSVENPNVVIATVDALAKAIRNSVVALQWFHILLVDHSFAHDATATSAQLVALQWNQLKESERPRFIDLVSNGHRPPPSADVPTQSERPTPLLTELVAPSLERRSDQLLCSFAPERRSDGASALLGDLKHESPEAISPTMVPSGQLDVFLRHLRAIDWDTGATMAIFVQDKGFAALLLRMINERLEYPVAVQAPGHLSQTNQIVVFPNPRDAMISQYDMIVTVERTGAVQMIQAMAHGEWSRVEFNAPPRDAQGPPPCPDAQAAVEVASHDRYMPYPYQRPSGTEINIFNCMSIFLSYCQALLGPQVDEDQLFQYTWDKAHRVDVLCSVTYPSPKGPVKLSKGQVHAAWAGRTLQDICSPEQGMSIPRSELQQRWFCYVAVMDVIRCGYLDCDNNVTARALPLNKDPKSFLNELQHRLPNLVLSYETVSLKSPALFQSEVCLQYNGKVFKFTGEVCNNKRYAEKTAALAAVLGITGGSPTAQATDLHLKQQMSALALSAPSSLKLKKGGGDPELSVDCIGHARAGKTAKMLLNELMQSMSRAATGKPPLLYTCQPVEDAWQATVHITRGGAARSFVGDVAFTKKASEESAALKALNDWTSKPMRTGKARR